MFLRFFRSLMPKEERFVERFIEHSDRIVAASDALAALMAAEEADRPARFRELTAIEAEADVVARQTLVGLHRAFITPFDRSDIHTLSSALDDIVDLIEEVAVRADLYQVTFFDPRMCQLAAMIQEAARLVADMVAMLSDIGSNSERINGLCERISKIEGDADDVLRQALSELIHERPETIVFFGRKEVYDLLEAVTDRCDDVADVVEGIVLDHV